MRLKGICSICGGIADPAYSCSMCGAIVCSKCFNSKTGLCKRCAAKVGGDRSSNETIKGIDETVRSATETIKQNMLGWRNG